jgi:hypothetical protein
MKSRFITDPPDASQDASDAFLDTAGAKVFTSFSPSPSHDPGSPSAGAPAARDGLHRLWNRESHQSHQNP